jgi:hypothetical protein
MMQVIVDMKALHLTIVPPRSCSDQQKRHHLIALANANIGAQRAILLHGNISRQVSLPAIESKLWHVPPFLKIGREVAFPAVMQHGMASRQRVWSNHVSLHSRL